MTPEERKREMKRISIQRGYVADFGVCSLCGDEDQKGILKHTVVSVELIERDGVINQLTLCDFHEGVLMMKFLSSYARRMGVGEKRREKKMGFKGKIPKEVPDGGEPSAFEKLQKGDILQ